VKDATTYVGFDAHKESIFVAMLVPGQSPVEWQLRNEPGAVRRLARKLTREAPADLRSCYEAGPCGYALQRQLVDAGVACAVVAPSLIPIKPGERIKTDRRDARKLAELLRAGLLTEVHPPTADEEAIRDLCRCRDAAKEDRERSRHRLLKLLLRRGLQYTTGKHWTRVHRRWLEQLHFERALDQTVFDDYLRALTQGEERLALLDAQLVTAAQQEPYRAPVGWLRCFRGIDTVTALGVVAELHGVARFRSARDLMAYLGVVPSEHSSAERHRRGAITKAGNRRVRRLIVEAAWHYQHRPGVGRALRQRRIGQPAHIITLADKAQQRLHRRFWLLVSARGKPPQIAVVAIARELTGFIWAALQPRPDHRQVA
jgi:transposase